jgi:WD40 repeat protein
MLAVGTARGVHLVDAATGKVQWKKRFTDVKKKEDWCRGVSMSPDGRFLASVSRFQEHWTIWELASGVMCIKGDIHDGSGACCCKVTRKGREMEEGCPLQAHTGGMRAVQFSPCGQMLATAGTDCAVILWDSRTGKVECVMRGQTQVFRSLSFSADGQRLAGGHRDLSISLWDTTTGALFRTIADAHAMSFHLQFSPTDSLILARAGDAHDGVDNITVKIWNIGTGEMLNSVAGRNMAVFSPDGLTIAAASSTNHGDVELFQIESGEVFSTLDANPGAGHTCQVFSVFFSRDGSKLASGDCEGTCNIFNVSTGALLCSIDLGSQIGSLSWGRDWVLDTERAIAFAMGHNPRLGAGSRLQGFDMELVRMIVGYSQEGVQCPAIASEEEEEEEEEEVLSPTLNPERHTLRHTP